MLDKSICDCNKSVRDFLRDAGIIDYDDLEAGDRRKFKATLDLAGAKEECDVSCYRANGRGDKRIWVTKVRDHANEGDELLFSLRNGNLYLHLK